MGNKIKADKKVNGLTFVNTISLKSNLICATYKRGKNDNCGYKHKNQVSGDKIFFLQSSNIYLPTKLVDYYAIHESLHQRP